MSAIIPSQLASTYEEANNVLLREYMSFIKNLFVAYKMKLLSKITYNMYIKSSLFSLPAADRGDVLAARNPFKEMDTWKGKCEANKQMCFSF